MLTNKYNLPEALVNAVENDTYDAGDTDLSATGMLQPYQQFALKQTCDEMQEDAADRIWALLGTAVHTILERVDDGNVKEERFFHKVDGWNISAQIDHFDLTTLILSDYKVTSVWAAKEVKPEWEAQLNVGAWLIGQSSFWRVEGLQIVAILRDWNAGGRKKNPKVYPEVPVKVLEIPMWEPEKTEAFIKTRIAGFKAALKGGYPPCTDEERWATPLTYAVHKGTNKGATRLFTEGKYADPCKAAFKFKEDMIEKTGDKYSVVQRDRGYRRCEGYCPVSHVCKQWEATNAK